MGLAKNLIRPSWIFRINNTNILRLRPSRHCLPATSAWIRSDSA